jgi:short-subunit dehydrogenase
MAQKRKTPSRRRRKPAGANAREASATKATKGPRGTGSVARAAGRRKQRSTALVTGASAGIGRQLAAVFAEHGHDLVLVARSRDKLRAVARELEAAHGASVTVVPKDLTAPGACRSLAASLRRRGIEVDVLVNDAGVLEYGEFHQTGAERLLRIVQLNVAALTELTRAFIGPMVDRGAGRVLNVASAAAFQAVPYMAVYAATKAYVLSLTEALSEELKGTGVTVTALCPGFTETPMLDNVRVEHAEQPGLYPSFLIADAATVAREGYRACMRGEVFHVPGVVNQVLTSAGTVQHSWLMRAFTAFLARRAI